MNKKILIVGNGAKEYALAKKLANNNKIYITPSCNTLKEDVTCLDIREDNIADLLEFAMENGIDMTIAPSSKAISADIATVFNKNKLPIFAPSAKANEIIANKAYAKKTLYKLRIPTPKFGIFEKLNIANDYIKNLSTPYVLKTNCNNSATIITSGNTAKNILESAFQEKNIKVIVEEYIYGTSFSFYALTDGYKAIPIGSSLTYRHSLDGNGGQLTGGMGSCTPNYKLSIDNECYLMKNVIYPTLDYLENAGNPFLGILGINGILTEDGEIIVLGWQSFTQDFDSDAIFNNINDDIYNLFESCIIGSFSDEYDRINIGNKQSVSLVIYCKNNENKENVIKGIENLSENIYISYYPCIRVNKYLEYEAYKGPIMVITASASSISKAREIAYNEASDIDFSGIYYRNDICKINI